MYTNRVGTDGRPIREIDAGDYPASVSNDLLDALKRIRSMALEHPCLDLERFDQRDLDGLAEEGGDVCDWTMLAIISNDALKIVGLGI